MTSDSNDGEGGGYLVQTSELVQRPPVEQLRAALEAAEQLVASGVTWTTDGIEYPGGEQTFEQWKALARVSLLISNLASSDVCKRAERRPPQLRLVKKEE